jgi:hypothetical protein
MKIFNADSDDVANALISHSNVQWPFGTFWVEGKTGSNCAAISDDKQTLFSKTNVGCYSLNHFHCEYICKCSD